jgi:hypothetical protein
MTRRDQWLAKVCRVCLRPNRDHADADYDDMGDCCAPRAEPSDLEVLLRASLIKAREQQPDAALVDEPRLRVVTP